jgi:hypothetical protein
LEDDVEDVSKPDSEYVTFRDLMATCRLFIGDDLPKVTSKPKQLKVVSAFRQEPETDCEADHIPVGPIIRSAVHLTQENFFGESAELITAQPTLPISAPDKKKS